MPLVSLPDVGTDIVFQSKAGAWDTTTYKGSLVAGAVSYDLAVGYGDVRAYHAKVRQADQTVAVDPMALQYFIVKLANSDGVADYRPFSMDWIVPGSLDTIEGAVKITLEAYYYPSSVSAQAMIAALAAIGVRAVVT